MRKLMFARTRGFESHSRRSYLSGSSPPSPYRYEEYISNVRQEEVEALRPQKAMFKKLDNETIALKEKIHLITKYQKPHIANSLKIMAQKSPSNVKVICDYIFAEQNEINIKESTKEGKIKCLVRLLRYLRYKPFETFLSKIYWITLLA